MTPKNDESSSNDGHSADVESILDASDDWCVFFAPHQVESPFITKDADLPSVCALNVCC